MSSKSSTTKSLNRPFPTYPKGLREQNTLTLLRSATCLVERADPALFSETESPWVDVALSYCGRCPVVDLCEATVRPDRSAFDGVCAGRVWVNGGVIQS